MPDTSEAVALNSMCRKAAAQKPASGATIRTILLFDRRATASPMPVIAVNSGWPKKVITPRRKKSCCSASSGGTSPKVRAAYRYTRP